MRIGWCEENHLHIWWPELLSVSCVGRKGCPGETQDEKAKMGFCPSHTMMFQIIEGNNSGICHTSKIVRGPGSGHAKLFHLKEDQTIVNSTFHNKEGIMMHSSPLQILKAAYSIFGNTIPNQMLADTKDSCFSGAHVRKGLCSRSSWQWNHPCCLALEPWRA